jgi:hypothetical protein
MRHGRLQYLVRWEGYVPKENLWLSEADLDVVGLIIRLPLQATPGTFTGTTNLVQLQQDQITQLREVLIEVKSLQMNLNGQENGSMILKLCSIPLTFLRS